MPNLAFYAVDDDWTDVLQAVFDLGLFRVMEADSAPGRDLIEFHSAGDAFASPPQRHLRLYVVGSGPEPIARRIEFLPDVSESASFRYTCEGWGLVLLHYGGPYGANELRLRRTNHISERRAKGWGIAPPLGDPAAWDWAMITSTSGKLNRTVRRMAVDKIGSHPVLPHAARYIADAGLRYEYGVGLHATPSALMLGR